MSFEVHVLLHHRIFATREDFRGGARQYRAATVRKRPLEASAISVLQLRSNVGRTPWSARVPLDPLLPLKSTPRGVVPSSARNHRRYGRKQWNQSLHHDRMCENRIAQLCGRKLCERFYSLGEI